MYDLMDLTFLTEREKQLISDVLNRDDEIRKREDARIERLKSKAARTNNAAIQKKIKMRTGEWFLELAEKQGGFKRDASVTSAVRASMRLRPKSAAGAARSRPIPIVEVEMVEDKIFSPESLKKEKDTDSTHSANTSEYISPEVSGGEETYTNVDNKGDVVRDFIPRELSDKLSEVTVDVSYTEEQSMELSDNVHVPQNTPSIETKHVHMPDEDDSDMQLNDASQQSWLHGESLLTEILSSEVGATMLGKSVDNTVSSKEDTTAFESKDAQSEKSHANEVSDGDVVEGKQDVRTHVLIDDVSPIKQQENLVCDNDKDTTYKTEASEEVPTTVPEVIVQQYFNDEDVDVSENTAVVKEEPLEIPVTTGTLKENTGIVMEVEIDDLDEAQEDISTPLTEKEEKLDINTEEKLGSLETKVSPKRIRRLGSSRRKKPQVVDDDEEVSKEPIEQEVGSDTPKDESMPHKKKIVRKVVKKSASGKVDEGGEKVKKVVKKKVVKKVVVHDAVTQ